MSTGFDLERYSRADLERRSGTKWRRHGGSAIGAWIADMDYPVAPEVTSAVRALLDADDLGYPDQSLEEEVREAFSERARKRYATVVDPRDVVVVSDVVQAIYLSLLAFTEPGDGVAFLTPAYPPFFGAVSETGRTALCCPLLRGASRYEVDLDALGSVVREGSARALLLCNPHNPTGRSFTRAELDGIAAIALDAGLVIVSDEIHADLTLPGAAHVAVASLGPEVASRTVTLFSASKAFNVAGLRCAVAAFGDPALRERFERFPAHGRGSVSVTGMVAAVAAWERADRWLDAVLAVLADNRDLVSDFAAGHLDGAHFAAPEATYLAWLDLRAYDLGEDPAAWLRARARVALSPGPDFGIEGRGHARLNFATSRSVLEEMLDRIASALEHGRPASV
ncbi:MAG: MalY/PatB family protein [Acidimicrobiales bacterium]